MVQDQTYFIENTTQMRNVVNIAPRIMSRVAMGYNGTHFYTGFSGIVDNYNPHLANKDFLLYTIGGGTLYVGYRFGVPKSLQKVSDKLEYYNPQKIIQRLKN